MISDMPRVWLGRPAPLQLCMKRGKYNAYKRERGKLRKELSSQSIHGSFTMLQFFVKPRKAQAAF